MDVVARASIPRTVRTRATTREDASLDAPRARERATTRPTRRVALAGAVALRTFIASTTREGHAARASDGAIAYEDVVIGSGVEPLAGVDVVKVNYAVSLEETGRRVDEAKIFVFGVGTGEVVPGFDQVVGGDGSSVPPMRVGGTRRAVVPASLAYGERGAGCRAGECEIPPGSALVFEVDLVSVK